MANKVLTSVEEGLGTITLNRPEALNAVDRETALLLAEATERMERDLSVRCVLYRGEGRAFCAGGDIKGLHAGLLKNRDAHASAMERRLVEGHLIMHRIRRMPKPVVTAFQGTTVGFGVSLVACSDLAIAADDAQLVMAYRHVGLSVDGGVSYFLPRIIGERRALQITLLGEKIDAETALEWGLANKVVPADELTHLARKIALSLARGPTSALAASKRLIRQSLDTGWDEQSADEARTFSEVTLSDDHLEGTSAFVQKRKPRFTGR